jgi:trimethylamine--corrinoid protein Co-methyltransferase
MKSKMNDIEDSKTTTRDGKKAPASGGQYRPLSPEDVEKIHETTIRVFKDVGIQLNDSDDIAIFKANGASVDGNVVKVPEKLVMECIESAPSRVTLYGRDSRHDLTIGDKVVYFGTGGTALFILEDGIRKEAKLRDLEVISKLVDHLDNIHFLLLPTYPSELEKEDVDINRFFAGLDNTKKHVMGGVYTSAGVQQIIEMAELIAGSPDSLREKPFISFITCVMDPLRLDKSYSRLMKQIASARIPLATPAEPMCGTTSPVTLAGNIVINNVDTLIGVILTQLVSRGTPVMYGCIGTVADPIDMKYLGAPIESALINAASAQLAQYYKLPYYATAGISDSKTVDAQCAYESAMSNLMCGLAGANYIHDAAGLMEFAKTVSLEKYVIDNEIIGMAMRAINGIEVNDETLAFDLIKNIGPGGNFLSSSHTRRYLRSEHYMPEISDRANRSRWETAGSKDTYERAGEKVREILSTPIESRIPPEIRAEILKKFKNIRGT